MNKWKLILHKELFSFTFCWDTNPAKRNACKIPVMTLQSMTSVFTILKPLPSHTPATATCSERERYPVNATLLTQIWRILTHKHAMLNWLPVDTFVIVPFQVISFGNHQNTALGKPQWMIPLCYVSLRTRA